MLATGEEEVVARQGPADGGPSLAGRAGTFLIRVAGTFRRKLAMAGF